jgi:two-component system LytT family response regulator
VVVVDDELLARRRLRRYLAEEQGISRVAECTSARAAAAIMVGEQPDVVFVDAGLPGVGGLGEMPGGGASVPVLVPVIADAQRALEREDLRPTNHLLKPVAREPLRAILDHVRRRVATPAVARPDDRLGHGVPGRLVIRSAGRILALPLEAVDWIEAADNYVLVHRGDRIHTVRGTLADFEVRLGAQRFVRIHRGAIVYVAAVEEVRSVRGAWQLGLRNGATVPVGRAHRGGARAARAVKEA